MAEPLGAHSSAALEIEDGEAEGEDDEEAGPRTHVNWINLLAFLLVVAHKLQVDLLGLDQAVGEVQLKYKTLVTPHENAFRIWFLIYVAEAVFVTAQLTEAFAKCHMVKAVSPWWCTACVLQYVWGLAFCGEYMFAAILFSCGLTACLLHAVSDADDIEDRTFAQYVLIRAPLALHGGWALCLTVGTWNAMMASLYQDDLTSAAMLSFAIESLGIMCAAVLYYAISRKPDPVICLVIFWAAQHLRDELTPDPPALTKHFQQWPHVVTQGIAGAAQWLSYGALGGAAVAAWATIQSGLQHMAARKASGSTLSGCRAAGGGAAAAGPSSRTVAQKHKGHKSENTAWAPQVRTGSRPSNVTTGSGIGGMGKCY